MTRFPSHGRWAGLVAIAGALAGTAPVVAQSLGTFRWQLQPFCNVVTVAVVQNGAVYTLDGYDDQCGAPQRAPLVGLATPNPDGTIGLGLHVVTAPGGRGLQIDARIDLASLGGPWTDSSGNNGTLAFGVATGGSPRPAPTIPAAALAAGSITSAQLAAGAVTAVQLAPGALNAAAAAFGTCPSGQYLRGLQPSGTVLCEPIGTPPISTTVDDVANIVGRDTSVAIGVDGLPIIGHHDPMADALRVTHCNNTACTSATSTTVDDPAGTSAGRFASLAIGTDGLAIIGHFDQTASAVRVTHCNNVACTQATTNVVDDPVNKVVGQYTSLAIGADGLAIISHVDSTLGALRVTHCNNVVCSSATSFTVDDLGNFVVGLFTSLAIGSDALAVISHYDVTAAALRVTHCDNVLCSSATSLTVDDPPAKDVGQYTSLSIGADGLPVISYRDVTAGGLRVTHCNDVKCTSGTSTTVDDPANNVGNFTSLAIGTDGLPVISHYDATANALRVSRCSNVACTSATSTVADEPANSVGLYTSVAIGRDGLPVISHHDSTADALRVTKCASRTCQ